MAHTLSRKDLQILFELHGFNQVWKEKDGTIHCYAILTISAGRQLLDVASSMLKTQGIDCTITHLQTWGYNTYRLRVEGSINLAKLYKYLYSDAYESSGKAPFFREKFHESLSLLVKESTR